MEDLLKAFEEARNEYMTDFKPEYDERKREAEEKLKNKSKGEAIVVTKGTENKNENFKDEDDKEGETSADVESLQCFLQRTMINKEQESTSKTIDQLP